MTDAPKETALDRFLRESGAKAGDEMDTAYRTLAARLLGKAGQCVLMIERSAEMPAGPCGGTLLPLIESFALGTLESDALRFDPENPHACWSFPTTRYARKGSHQFKHVEDDSVCIEEGGMRPWFGSIFYRWIAKDVDLAGLRRPEMAGLSIGVDDDRPKRLSLHVGNGEIAAWCLERHAQRVRTIAEMATAIGADPKALFAGPLVTALEKAVERLRGSPGSQPIRAKIRFLLDEAARLGIDEPYVRRVRAGQSAK